jgi:hypothetical protein
MSLEKKGSITPHKPVRDESEDNKREHCHQFQTTLCRQVQHMKPPLKEVQRRDWLYNQQSSNSKHIRQTSRDPSTEVTHNSLKQGGKVRTGVQKANENYMENIYQKNQSKSRDPQQGGGNCSKIMVEGTVIKPLGFKASENQNKFSLLRAHRQTPLGSVHISRNPSDRHGPTAIDTPSQRLISIPEETVPDRRVTLDRTGFFPKEPIPKTVVINQIVNSIIAHGKQSFEKKTEPDDKHFNHNYKDSPNDRDRNEDPHCQGHFPGNSHNSPKEAICQFKQVAPKFKIKSLLKTPSKRPNVSTENLPILTDFEQSERPFSPVLLSSNTEIAAYQATFQALEKSVQRYLAAVPGGMLDNCDSNFAQLFGEVEDLRYHVLQRKDKPWKGLDVGESVGILGLALYAYDAKNFKSHRMIIHHLSATSVAGQLLLLQKVEESIFSSQERPIDEIFFKVRHRKTESGDYESLPKEIIDRLKPIGWKWKMVLNELEARYTIFWKKRDLDLFGPAIDICHESFKVVFAGFLSNDPGIVFLNKRETTMESALCVDLMGFFGHAFKEKLFPTEKTSQHRLITSSSLMIKSQVDDMSSHDQQSHIDVATPKEKRKLLGSESCRNHSKSNQAQEEVAADQAGDGKDDIMLYDYTEVKQIDNSPQLANELEVIFKSKARDKHLKKLHFQTQNRYLSLLSTFRLAVRLPKTAVRTEFLNNKTLHLIRIQFFSKIESGFNENTVFLVNTLDPNFKLFITKADLNGSDENFRRGSQQLENKLNTFDDGPFESGCIWVPQFQKASIFDYFGQEDDVRSFCKFDLSLSHAIGSNSILSSPKPTDVKLRNDYLMGVVKINPEQSRLSLLATFKIAKTNFI